MKFRKKPVVIEAIQVTGKNSRDIFKWAGEINAQNSVIDYGNYLEIKTLEGTMRADINDWIICGVKNELYPCKPDIFETTYEKVN